MKKSAFALVCLFAVACTSGGGSGGPGNTQCPDLDGEYQKESDPTEKLTFAKNAKGELVGTDRSGSIAINGVQHQLKGGGTVVLNCSNGTIIGSVTQNGQTGTTTITKTPKGFSMTSDREPEQWVKVGGNPDPKGQLRPAPQPAPGLGGGVAPQPQARPFDFNGGALAEFGQRHRQTECPNIPAGTYREVKDNTMKNVLTRNAQGEMVFTDDTSFTVNGTPHTGTDGSRIIGVCTQGSVELLIVNPQGEKITAYLRAKGQGYAVDVPAASQGSSEWVRE